MHYTVFADSPEPLATVLRNVGSSQAAAIVAAAAVISLPTVILAFLYGQSRIFFVMARDGLFPQALATVSPRTGTPVRITVVTAVVIAMLAAFVPLGEIAALANAGTLVAFISVSVCMLVLRRTATHRPRLFRTPAPWLIGPAGIFGCLYLFGSLPKTTHISFGIWSVAGLALYLLWGARRLRRARAA
jgi:APA family basic amino acid/polyamine antiporter